MIPLRNGLEGATRAADFGKDFLGHFCPDEGFGVGIVMVEVVVEAASSSGTEVKTPRRMRSWVIKPKKRSNWLSHHAEVGVKCR